MPTKGLLDGPAHAPNQETDSSGGSKEVLVVAVKQPDTREDIGACLDIGSCPREGSEPSIQGCEGFVARDTG